MRLCDVVDDPILPRCVAIWRLTMVMGGGGRDGAMCADAGAFSVMRTARVCAVQLVQQKNNVSRQMAAIKKNNKKGRQRR